MTNQEILEKAIQKAVDGGWKQFGNDDWDAKEMAAEAFDIRPSYSIQEIIFNHDFAKALWGECTTWIRPNTKGKLIPNDGWQYHVQQMVINRNPVQYLGENI